MYCPINGAENSTCVCNRCCRLYNIAAAFIAVLITLTLGLILGAYFASTLIEALPVIITSAVILAVLLIVTLLTRGCCSSDS